MEISPTLSLEIEPNSEDDGEWHPAEIEDAAHEVHRRAVVQGEVFIGSQHRPLGDSDAEESLLGGIKSLDIHRIHLIIGKKIHPVVRDAKDEEREQCHHKFARTLTRNKE